MLARIGEAVSDEEEQESEGEGEGSWEGVEARVGGGVFGVVGGGGGRGTERDDDVVALRSDQQQQQQRQEQEQEQQEQGLEGRLRAEMVAAGFNPEDEEACLAFALHLSAKEEELQRCQVCGWSRSSLLHCICFVWVGPRVGGTLSFHLALAKEGGCKDARYGVFFCIF